MYLINKKYNEKKSCKYDYALQTDVLKILSAEHLRFANKRLELHDKINSLKHNDNFYLVSKEFFGKFILDNGLYVAPMEYLSCELPEEVVERYNVSCEVPFSSTCTGTLAILHKPVYGWFKSKRTKHEIDVELLERYPLGIVYTDAHFYHKYEMQSYVDTWVKNKMKHSSLPWKLPVTMIERNLFFTFIPSQQIVLLFSVGDDCVFVRAVWKTHIDPRWCF